VRVCVCVTQMITKVNYAQNPIQTDKTIHWAYLCAGNNAHTNTWYAATSLI